MCFYLAFSTQRRLHTISNHHRVASLPQGSEDRRLQVRSLLRVVGRLSASTLSPTRHRNRSRSHHVQRAQEQRRAFEPSIALVAPLGADSPDAETRLEHLRDGRDLHHGSAD
jgi:hypothetical protein